MSMPFATLGTVCAADNASRLSDPIEFAAGYGRWWLDVREMHLILSAGAAHFLDVEAGTHADPESAFTHVVPEDMLPLIDAMIQTRRPGIGVDCEFRVATRTRGLRCLRLQSVHTDGAGRHSGVLVDVTPARQVEMRERFSYAITQFLVGSHALEEALPRVIQMVCEHLGWEWGAYWAMEHDPMGASLLACRHFWAYSDYALAAFTRESQAVRMAPGEGFVGQVWASNEAAWIENMKSDAGFLRRASARECALESGFAFPVSYVAADGQRHSVGVLEFFSTLARQPDAQLPSLSASIGALIAQTVQRMEQQEIMRRLAQTDELTGLYNRSHMRALLDAACMAASQNSHRFGLLYIDLDRFKPINDAFGHDAGNLVLQEFSQRLMKLAPGDAHIGRLGGDEFVIIGAVPAGADPVTALQALGEQVLNAARAPFHFEGNELKVSASVGISIFADNGWNPAELLRSADAAMYRSKKSGRNAVSFFPGSGNLLMAQQQTTLAQELTIEAELHRALAEDEFFLEYQPVYDNFQGRMVAVEALIRWQKPNGELVRPDLFIGIAEKSRLIVQIGRWVVQRACGDLAQLHRAGMPDLKMHVNMAAAEFANAKLAQELRAVVDACGIKAQHLCLELTEGMVMKQPEKVIPVMRLLRQHGFHISLDDFGIGHSSLSRLKKLPITSVKIDRSFVAGLPHDRGDGAIVRTILDLGRHMHLSVIAEGVETDAQLAYLGQFGCALVQGYLMSRPQPLQMLLDLGESSIHKQA